MTKNSPDLHPLWQKMLAALPPPVVVTLIGGGGKTSLMYYLTAGLKAAGRAAFAVATAKLFVPEGDGRTAVIAGTIDDCRQAVADLWASPLLVTLAGGRVVGNQRKLAGLDPSWIDALADEFPAAVFIVEGDGSAGLPLKGHLDHDPVVPAATRLLVPVIGIDVLGQPLATPHVHRPARAAELAGAQVGQAVTAEIIVRLLLHPAGYMHNCPPGCLVVPFINKAETEGSRQAAADLAQAVLAAGHPAVAGVVTGSLDRREFCYYRQESGHLAACTVNFPWEKQEN